MHWERPSRACSAFGRIKGIPVGAYRWAHPLGRTPAWRAPGTVVDIQFQSKEVFIFFQALAARAIILILGELLAVAKRFKR